MNDGYILLSRRLFASPQWAEAREFSEAEAWIDLIQLAAWRERKVSVRKAIITLRRGEVLTAIRFLASKWGWGDKQVRGMLARYEKSGALVAQRETAAGRIYLLVNYEAYQSPRRSEDSPTDDFTPRRGHTQGTPRAHSGHTQGTYKKEGKRRKDMKRREEATTTSAHEDVVFDREREHVLTLIEGGLGEGDTPPEVASELRRRIAEATSMDELGQIKRDLFAASIHLQHSATGCTEAA